MVDTLYIAQNLTSAFEFERQQTVIKYSVDFYMVFLPIWTVRVCVIDTSCLNKSPVRKLKILNIKDYHFLKHKGSTCITLVTQN